MQGKEDIIDDLGVIALLALLAAFVWMVIPQLYLSIESMIANSAGYVQKVYEWLDTLVLDPELEAMLGTSFGSASSFVIDIVEDHVCPGWMALWPASPAVFSQ